MASAYQPRRGLRSGIALDADLRGFAGSWLEGGRHSAELKVDEAYARAARADELSGHVDGA